MCGILAVIGKKDKELVAKLSSRMAHRGPDERDIHESPIGVLSHERLSIIDVNTGRQPIQGTRDTWVIHNGEIYNHKKLHAETLKGKYPCRTTSDSEVIVHLYEEFGYDFCDMLDGMFALVVLDVDNNKYIVARDPIGIKPLYYGKDKDGDMWFASEMKAICDICVEFEAFPPGHYYTAETGFVKYYNPSWEDPATAVNDDSGLREVVEKAVEKRLMCDVPFGVLLSGGLDSSLIASIVARKLRGTGQELHSFSVGVNSEAPDLKAAREVAKFIGSTHHEVNFTIQEGLDILDKLIWHLETYDVTSIRASTPMYFLSRYITKSGIKMVLSGEGADEVFGGYLYFYNAPSDLDFQKETIERVQRLSTADLLRADKSTMANGLEARVPMLDKAVLQLAMTIRPELKRSIRKTATNPGRIEKYVLRKAFDDKNDPYLPDSILWRQKEQFSDGVGYSWIDSLIEFCEKQVSDAEFSKAAELFPYNTPATKEAFYFRTIFHKHFPQDDAAKTVRKWIPKWQANQDPSGRANAVHEATIESEVKS